MKSERERRVLLVDDEERLVRNLKVLLTDQGYAVDTAAGGEEGCALLEEHRYCAVITDLRMARGDGFQVLAYGHDHAPETPIIVMTAYDELTERLERKPEYAQAHVLMKPFDIAEFVRVVRAACEDSANH